MSPFPYTWPIVWQNFPVARGRIRSIYRHCAPGVFEMWAGFASNTTKSPLGVPSFTPDEPVPKWAEDMKDFLFAQADLIDSQADRILSLEYSVARSEFVDYFKLHSVYIQVLEKDTALTVADDKFRFTVPAEFDGMILIDADAFVDTASTSGLPTFQIHNLTDGVDILSTEREITIDENEKNSFTAATQPVIDTANDDLAGGDVLRFDCDVAGTGAKGLGFRLILRKP